MVRAVPAPGTAEKSRKFFDDMNEWARGEGFAGLGYATRKGGEWGGPIAKNHGAEGMDKLAEAMGLGPDDGIFFAAGKEEEAAKLAGARPHPRRRAARPDRARTRSASAGSSISRCSNITTSRRRSTSATTPSRCRRARWRRWRRKDPLDILAWQYDIVCNGVELSSGAIRNHRPDIMYKAFEIAGYTQEEVDTNFPGMINAFKFGAPPHGGSAPGIDRIVMLLADEPNIREVILFPMNQKAEDLMMNAPAAVMPKQLKELHIKLDRRRAAEGLRTAPFRDKKLSGAGRPPLSRRQRWPLILSCG